MTAEDRYSWECNECGLQEYTMAVSEDDVHEWLACSNCGGVEFHKAPSATTEKKNT